MNTKTIGSTLLSILFIVNILSANNGLNTVEFGLIVGSVTQVNCNGLGTVDPFDDLIELDVSAVNNGAGPSGMFTVVHVLDIYGPFNYGVSQTLTLPFSSSLSLTFIDVDDLSCSEIVTIMPSSCSPCSMNYVTQGNASQLDSNCYELTNVTSTYQSGQVWGQNTLNLNKPFTMNFTLNFGDRDSLGADGMMFILQPIGNIPIGNGGGFGFPNFPVSAGFEFDTWMNDENDGNFNDPAADHLGFLTNGSLLHPTDMAVGNYLNTISLGNIEDGSDHQLTISWNPETMLFSCTFDGTNTLDINIDLLTHFGVNPNVYWGWSGGTGYRRNDQIVCINSVEIDPLSLNSCLSYDQIDITVSGGQEPYTYQWSTGSTDEDLDMITHPINYSVTITDLCNQTLFSTFSDSIVNCGCVTNLSLHENPQADFRNRASYQINSDDIVDYNVLSSYIAGDHIDLDQGFEVESGSEFIADIDNCPEDCQVSTPCESTPCIEPEYELDSEGNKYVPNQLTISRPTSFGPSTGSADDIRNEIDSFLYYSDFVLNNPLPTFMEFQMNTSISKCLCDREIYLYDVDPSIQINEEGGGIAANTNNTPKEEGYSVSLNHYLSAGMLDEEPSVPSPSSNFILGHLNPDKSLPRVAFLDSGVNPEILPDNSLLGLAALFPGIIESQQCNNTVSVDTFGWNFVEDNSDVKDYRGHGTAVYLSYLAALDRLDIDVSDQNSIIVKVLDDCGIGTAYSAACGLHYAVIKDAEIINASWGLHTNNILIQTAVDELTDAGIILSCSSGNSGKDLVSVGHFPSGYGYPHSRIISLETQTYSLSLGIESVFEVSGLCRDSNDLSCVMPTEDVPLWTGANYRSSHHVFAEPAIEIQLIINSASGSSIPCGIMGTSYANPMFTAGLLQWYIDNSNQYITKTLIQSNSVTWNTDKGSYSSYLLNNDIICN